MVDFEVCFASSSCWNTQPLFNFFSKHTFFGGGQKCWFHQSKARCSKRLQGLVALFCVPQTLNFCVEVILSGNSVL